MLGRESDALFQRFLPDACQRAFVWKYSEAVGGLRPRHFHAEPEVNLVVCGAGRFAVGRTVLEVARGDLVAFAPGQDHALIERSPDLFLLAIGLDGRYASEAAGARCEPVVPFHVALGPSEFETVLDRAAGLVERKDAAQLGAELWERTHWLARRARPRGSQSHVLTRRALQVLWRAPELELNLIARELRTQASELSRHFHRDLGIPFVRYRARVRLLKFFELVDADSRDLGQAAAAAGFGSYSQCHRIFRAELGASPRGFFSKGRAEMERVYSDRSEPITL